jgi:hypothetical protein
LSAAFERRQIKNFDFFPHTQRARTNIDTKYSYAML